MRKFLFPRIHGPDYDLCIRSISMSFIDDSSLDSKCLNGNNINLNANYKGSAILATKFLKGIKPSKSICNDEGFRMTTLHQLGDLLRMIGVFPRHKYQKKTPLATSQDRLTIVGGLSHRPLAPEI